MPGPLLKFGLGVVPITKHSNINIKFKPVNNVALKKLLIVHTAIFTENNKNKCFSQIVKALSKWALPEKNSCLRACINYMWSCRTKQALASFSYYQEHTASHMRAVWQDDDVWTKIHSSASHGLEHLLFFPLWLYWPL